jgi:hypothetical protein
MDLTIMGVESLLYVQQSHDVHFQYNTSATPHTDHDEPETTVVYRDSDTTYTVGHTVLEDVPELFSYSITVPTLQITTRGMEHMINNTSQWILFRDRYHSKIHHVIFDTETECRLPSETFAGWSSLQTVTFQPGSRVTEIGPFAFKKCPNLSSVRMSASMKIIGKGAFHSCTSLVSFHIPIQCTSVGPMAFSGCSSLETLEVLSVHPVEFGYDVFHGTNITTIYVPIGSSIPNEIGLSVVEKEPYFVNKLPVGLTEVEYNHLPVIVKHHVGILKSLVEPVTLRGDTTADAEVIRNIVHGMILPLHITPTSMSDIDRYTSVASYLYIPYSGDSFTLGSFHWVWLDDGRLRVFRNGSTYPSEHVVIDLGDTFVHVVTKSSPNQLDLLLEISDRQIIDIPSHLILQQQHANTVDIEEICQSLLLIEDFVVRTKEYDADTSSVLVEWFHDDIVVLSRAFVIRTQLGRDDICISANSLTEYAWDQTLLSIHLGASVRETLPFQFKKCLYLHTVKIQRLPLWIHPTTFDGSTRIKTLEVHMHSNLKQLSSFLSTWLQIVPTTEVLVVSMLTNIEIQNLNALFPQLVIQINISPDNFGCGGGDPYIFPCLGDAFKLPNIPRVYQLYQDDEVTINAQVSAPVKKIQEHMQTYIERFHLSELVSVPDETYFFSKIHFIHRTESICLDFTDNSTLTKYRTVSTFFNMSEPYIEDVIFPYQAYMGDTTRGVSVNIRWSNILFRVSVFKNSHIQNGVSMYGINVETSRGLLVRNTKPKHYQVRDLSTLRRLPHIISPTKRGLKGYDETMLLIRRDTRT